MKRATFNFFRPLLALLALKILFFAVFFSASSCNKESKPNKQLTDEQENAIRNFGQTLKSQRTEILSFIERHKDEIEALNNSYLNNTPIADISLEDSINFILNPSTKNATIVLNAFGATNQDIIDSLGSITDSRQVTAAFVVLGDENLIEPVLLSNNLMMSFFGTTAYAKPKWLECIGVALGLETFNSLRHIFESGGQQGAKKILKEVAKRFLGPGAVLTVIGTYLWCMW